MGNGELVPLIGWRRAVESASAWAAKGEEVNTLMICLCLSLNGGGPRTPDRFFGEDKLQHFFVSFLATSLSASGARAAGLDADTSLWVGAATGTTIGLAKELSDMRNPQETPSLLDFIWDLGGVGAAPAVVAQSR